MSALLLSMVGFAEAGMSSKLRALGIASNRAGMCADRQQMKRVQAVARRNSFVSRMEKNEKARAAADVFVIRALMWPAIGGFALCKIGAWEFERMNRDWEFTESIARSITSSL